MKTALVVAGASPHGDDLAADLGAVGIRVLGATNVGALVHDAARLAPDFVAWHDNSPDADLFDACARLAAAAPRPVLGFTRDPDAAKIERALHSGVHAYVVNGYALNRLRSVIHLALARYTQQRKWQGDLADVNRRFDERKLVDRAKGILMRARQVSEEEAFRTLRTASMASQRRVGQVSQQVIDAAHYAEAVNRAGKLRMLSQRLVKAGLLRLHGGEAAVAATALLEDSVLQIETDIAALARSLSQPTFGDLLEAVAGAWGRLRAALVPRADATALVELDAAAEALLEQADRLTRHLETAGLVTTLHVINVSGRQRMLSQRSAKLALLGVLLQGDAAARAQADLVATRAGFTRAMDYLTAIPLSTREIRDALTQAARSWDSLAHACDRVDTPAGQRAVSDASEALVAQFERLTDHYERSMQVLMG